MIDDTWRSQVRPTLEDFVDMFVVAGRGSRRDSTRLITR
jgi:hypothetical protein